jgi:hypothetical protein
MKHARQVSLWFFLAVGVCCAGLVENPEVSAPEPMKDDVPPIRNCAIKVIITSNLTYSAKDEASARGSLPEQVLARLTTLGASDGNTFRIASGEATNFTLHYTVSNDGNDRFTGSITVNGWGWGYITTIYNGEYSFSNAPQMIDAMTDKFYPFIHEGWRDSRKGK